LVVALRFDVEICAPASGTSPVDVTSWMVPDSPNEVGAVVETVTVGEMGET
jgi:hypothetical protein